MSTHKTDYVLLFVITACASLATIFILSKISYEVDTVSPQQETTIMRNESTPLATFNALVGQGWKVYRDEEKNIEFAYPENATIENSINIVKISFKNIPFYYQEIDTSNFFYILISKDKNSNKEKLTIQKWWEQNGPQTQRQAPYPDEEGETEIANNMAYKTYYLKSQNILNQHYDFVDYFVAKDFDIYEISSQISPRESDLSDKYFIAAKEYETQFNQILSSFHFLK